jgi:hypothetical protein
VEAAVLLPALLSLPGRQHIRIQLLQAGQQRQQLLLVPRLLGGGVA